MAQDSALSRAIARQEILRREIEERQEEINKIDTFISLYPQFADDAPPHQSAASSSESSREDVADQNQADASDTGHGAKRRSGLTQPEFERIGRELLLARGRPAHRRAFLDLFQERNIVVGGTDELKNLGTKIWNARAVLINISGEGYWPVDVPCPVVGYIPSQEGHGAAQQTFAELHSAA
jgi:hypothetical protein